MTTFDKAGVMTAENKNYCMGCGVFVMHPEFIDGQPYCPGCHRQKIERDGGRIVELEGKGHAMGPFARAIKLDPAGDEKEQAPIGESEPTERCDEVNIPLPLQKKLLHSSFYNTLQWLVELLDDDDFVCDLEEMAEARMEQAHPKWGSTMYTWDEHRRFRAIMEELADVMVYKSSEG